MSDKRNKTKASADSLAAFTRAVNKPRKMCWMCNREARLPGLATCSRCSKEVQSGVVGDEHNMPWWVSDENRRIGISDAEYERKMLIG